MLPKRIRLLAALVAAVLLAVGVTGSAHADPGGGIATGPLEVGPDNAILNYNSGLCLVVRGGAGDAPVVSTPCARYADQVWYATWAPDASYQVQFRNRNSGKCLLARSHGAYANRAVQTPCNWAYPDQRWWIVPVERDGGTMYWIMNVHSGLCLIQRGDASGAQAVVGGCDTQYDDQFWLGVPARNLPHP